LSLKLKTKDEDDNRIQSNLVVKSNRQTYFSSNVWSNRVIQDTM